MVSGACFLATVSAFRPLGRAHPFSLRTPFPREGVAAGLPAFLVLAAAYGLFYGVSVVVLLSVAAEAAPPERRSGVINTYGFGSDVAQLLGPWGLGLAAGAWGLRGALAVAGAAPLVGAAVFLATRRAPSPTGPPTRAPRPAPSEAHIVPALRDG